MSKGYKRFAIAMTVCIIILNLTAWISKVFCDWYIKYIFQIWPVTYGRLTGFFPFSVGEIMIAAGALLAIAALVIVVLIIFFRKKERFMRFAKRYYSVLLVIFLCVCLVMTLNCTLLYHCTPIDPNEELPNREYTIDELEILYSYVVEQCNYYSDKMDRDEEGHVVYDKNINSVARASMNNISTKYTRLKGYYPDVKELISSDLMSQSYICGYYFPFSMEANVNADMYIMNFPATYCHELSHLKGYIYEDEANFLGYLACIESGDDLFIYSGYLSVLAYVQNAYLESIADLPQAERDARLSGIVACNNQVYEDDVFLLQETWDKVEEKAVIDTAKVEQISETFTDTSLRLNGVSEGIAVYDGVVELLLQYYDGTLYVEK